MELDVEGFLYNWQEKGHQVTKFDDIDLEDGEEHPSFTFLKYKKVEGIYFPFKKIHRTKLLDGSYGNRDIIIKKIKLNPEFDKNLFDLNKRINNPKN